MESMDLGLDLGFHIGEYGEKEFLGYYRQKPRCVSVTSIYICRDCQDRIKQNKWIFFNDINIIPIVKKLVTRKLLKKMMIEELEDEKNI